MDNHPYYRLRGVSHKARALTTREYQWAGYFTCVAAITYNLIFRIMS